MKSILRYTLLTAMRDWLFVGLMLLILVSTGLSIFLGGTALSEQMQMSTSYIAGLTRIITVIGLVIFVCFHVCRSFENKEVELTLTRPISRSKYVIAYFSGFAMLALLVVIPVILLFSILHFIGLLSLNWEGVFFWSLSFLLETLVMVAMAFFSALILNSAVSSVLLCFGFYFMSRIYGFFLISVHNPASIAKGGKVVSWMENVLEVIGIVLPRFDMLSKSEWLIYGVNDYNFLRVIILAVLLYIPFVLSMTIFDFLRKQF